MLFALGRRRQLGGMKNVLLFVSVLGIAALLIGATAFHRLASLKTQLSFSTETESNEVLAGCVSFYIANKHWPRTEDDIRAGLKAAHREPKFLPTLTKLTLVEHSGALDVKFTVKDGLPMELHLDAPK